MSQALTGEGVIAAVDLLMLREVHLFGAHLQIEYLLDSDEFRTGFGWDMAGVATLPSLQRN